ncbi:hypothetical protein SAMN04487964_1039 [Marinobacterium sediminicola]|uniref:Uncharacterized protein n=1 Tax=Marinobacterium sediminicola TaxID=518898 RepID=A0ABY1RY45_9GAMM|nr:hypothetical protein SAMN04487964_1039 [Marinobacterium sediminicola]
MVPQCALTTALICPRCPGCPPYKTLLHTTLYPTTNRGTHGASNDTNFLFYLDYPDYPDYPDVVRYPAGFASPGKVLASTPPWTLALMRQPQQVERKQKDLPACEALNLCRQYFVVVTTTHLTDTYTWVNTPEINTTGERGSYAVRFKAETMKSLINHRNTRRHKNNILSGGPICTYSFFSTHKNAKYFRCANSENQSSPNWPIGSRTK